MDYFRMNNGPLSKSKMKNGDNFFQCKFHWEKNKIAVFKKNLTQQLQKNYPPYFICYLEIGLIFHPKQINSELPPVVYIYLVENYLQFIQLIVNIEIFINFLM